MDAGYYVVRFDNRDTGLSSRFAEGGTCGGRPILITLGRLWNKAGLPAAWVPPRTRTRTCNTRPTCTHTRTLARFLQQARLARARARALVPWWVRGTGSRTGNGNGNGNGNGRLAGLLAGSRGRLTPCVRRTVPRDTTDANAGA